MSKWIIAATMKATRNFVPNLRHLRALCAVVRTGSVSKAAESVYLSQPAVTQAIKKLESSLEIEILRKAGSGIEVTAIGCAYAARAERAIEIVVKGIQETLHATGSSRSKSARQLLPLLSTTQLRAFVAVGKTSNFTLAARIAGSSQPAVHRSTRELESVLETSLLRSTSKGAALTDAGQILWRNLRLAFSELEQAVSEVGAMRGIAFGSVVVGCMPLSRHILLPDAILDFSAAFPTIDVRAIESPYADLLHGLRHADVDLMIGALREKLPFRDVRQEPLFSAELCIAARAGHPLASRSSVKTSDLMQFPWVVPIEGTPTRDRFEKLMRSQQEHPRYGLIETSSMILIRGLLINSDRLTIISREQVLFEIGLGQLVALDVNLDQTSRTIGITTRLGWKPTSIQEAFLNSLRRAARLRTGN